MPKIALGLFIVLAAFGTLLAIGTQHIAEVAVPFLVAAHIAEFTAIALSVSWGPLVLALPWIVVARSGTSAASTPTPATGWLPPQKDDDDAGPGGHSRHDVARPPEPARYRP